MNNFLMLLPFLMGMKNNSNLSGIMSALLGMDNNQNPMMSMLMNMMSNKFSENPPPQKQDDTYSKKQNIDTFEAIKNLSGEEVTEALKILLNNSK